MAETPLSLGEKTFITHGVDVSASDSIARAHAIVYDNPVHAFTFASIYFSNINYLWSINHYTWKF